MPRLSSERFEHHEAIGQVAAPVQEGDKGGEIIVELGGGLVKVQRPCASRDDVTEVSLDLGLTYEGMIKELKALESLSVGDMMWTNRSKTARYQYPVGRGSKEREN